MPTLYPRPLSILGLLCLEHLPICSSFITNALFFLFFLPTLCLKRVISLKKKRKERNKIKFTYLSRFFSNVMAPEVACQDPTAGYNHPHPTPCLAPQSHFVYASVPSCILIPTFLKPSSGKQSWSGTHPCSACSWSVFVNEVL